MMGGGASNFLDSFSNSTLLNQPQKIAFAPVSELDSERFQQLWMQLPIGCGGPIHKSLRLDYQFSTQGIENDFKEKYI
jgi:hypothetical protein